MDPKRLEKLDSIIDWELKKPKKDSDWAEDVKKENLDVKFDHQLDEMLETHADKLSKTEEDLDVFTNWPDVKRYELTQRFTQMFKDQEVDGVVPETIEGKTLQEWVDEEFESQHNYYLWKVAKLNQSVDRIAKEIELRATGKLEVKDDKKLEGDDPKRAEFDTPGSMKRSPIGTTYYIDADNGNNGNAGTSTGAAWDTLDQFTENARSAGDIAILRGGMTDGYDDGTDLNFTSDGTIAAPIQITADYGNAFGDRVDLSGTATATLTFGSKTITFSADVSGVVAAGDIIYASGDAATEFAYQVASVATTTVTLYLPYKGAQAGSGKTMYNLQNPPHWQDSAASDFQWNFDTDNYWKVQGVLIRGTDANGQVELDSSVGHDFKDCIFQGNGSNDYAVQALDDLYICTLKKCRSFNNQRFLVPNLADVYGAFYIKDSLFDANNINPSSFYQQYGGSGNSKIIVEEVESKNAAGTNSCFISNQADCLTEIYLRNMLIDSTNKISVGTGLFNQVYTEDYLGVIGDSRLYPGYGTFDTPIFQSETTTVRSGGSNKSIKVTPVANIANIWDFHRLKIFELPIYASTDSKTYTVYFKTNDTANWTADPTASELWIELEAWGHASNNFRKITKSTGTIDFNGSTDWQSLTVTVAPAQAGVAYLRCWYAKTKETPSNVFYVDCLPVIS